MFVLTKPGETMFTRAKSFHSNARDLPRCITAALWALYTAYCDNAQRGACVRLRKITSKIILLTCVFGTFTICPDIDAVMIQDPLPCFLNTLQ